MTLTVYELLEQVSQAELLSMQKSLLSQVKKGTFVSMSFEVF